MLNCSWCITNKWVSNTLLGKVYTQLYTLDNTWQKIRKKKTEKSSKKVTQKTCRTYRRTFYTDCTTYLHIRAVLLIQHLTQITCWLNVRALHCVAINRASQLVYTSLSARECTIHFTFDVWRFYADNGHVIVACSLF